MLERIPSWNFNFSVVWQTKDMKMSKTLTQPGAIRLPAKNHTGADF